MTYFQTSNDPDIQALFQQMNKFEDEGKGVFMNDWKEREPRLKNSKYAAIDQDWLSQSLRSSDCNFHYLGIGMRPVNVGFGFQRNSAYNVIFSDAYVNHLYNLCWSEYSYAWGSLNKSHNICVEIP